MNQPLLPTSNYAWDTLVREITSGLAAGFETSMARHIYANAVRTINGTCTSSLEKSAFRKLAFGAGVQKISFLELVYNGICATQQVNYCLAVRFCGQDQVL
jgi:hypothetical protein